MVYLLIALAVPLVLFAFYRALAYYVDNVMGDP
jgi:hypothetical protein